MEIRTYTPQSYVPRRTQYCTCGEPMVLKTWVNRDGKTLKTLVCLDCTPKSWYTIQTTREVQK